MVKRKCILRVAMQLTWWLALGNAAARAGQQVEFKGTEQVVEGMFSAVTFALDTNGSTMLLGHLRYGYFIGARQEVGATLLMAAVLPDAGTDTSLWGFGAYYKLHLDFGLRYPIALYAGGQGALNFLEAGGADATGFSLVALAGVKYFLTNNTYVTLEEQMGFTSFSFRSRAETGFTNTFVAGVGTRF